MVKINHFIQFKDATEVGKTIIITVFFKIFRRRQIAVFKISHNRRFYSFG
ncbi:hypothetical protein [Helicobacter sp. MIT 05-5294]|nr:hypothetical protein [Helicobacter sp. MIT 05-5294]